jgi:hypothetical protein
MFDRRAALKAFIRENGSAPISMTVQASVALNGGLKRPVCTVCLNGVALTTFAKAMFQAAYEARRERAAER